MSESRFTQADREARSTLWVYAAFFVWWSVGAFGLGRWAETTLLGLPAWFMVSCVVSYPLVCVGLWLVLRGSFQHMPLSADKNADNFAYRNELDNAAAPAPASPPHLTDERGTDEQRKGERS